MNRNGLIKLTNCGLYCEAGDFYIDPWRGVDRAVITHAHSDHARWGSKRYLAVSQSERILKHRLGDISLRTLEYGEKLNINGVQLSLHPAGHVLGSAQVRIEYKGEVWVITGDYKIEKDYTSGEFELVKCHSFLTESTFGLPIYKWCPQNEIFDEINDWWRRNSSSGILSVIFGYSLGKAQRIISGLDSGIGKIFTHGAVENINAIYRDSGVDLPDTIYAGDIKNKKEMAGGIFVAPPSADAPATFRSFPEYQTAFASGWMQVRGNRRRMSVDRGFVLSDHVDWDGIIDTIKNNGAENIYVTHGYSAIVAKWLNENGWNAEAVPTRFEGEAEEAEPEESGSAGKGREV